MNYASAGHVNGLLVEAQGFAFVVENQVINVQRLFFCNNGGYFEHIYCGPAPEGVATSVLSAKVEGHFLWFHLITNLIDNNL